MLTDTRLTANMTIIITENLITLSNTGTGHLHTYRVPKIMQQAEPKKNLDTLYTGENIRKYFVLNRCHLTT
jgi:hypothetical protein